jgi:photosystem II stability/assembly factor-like uncharacterized protein
VIDADQTNTIYAATILGGILKSVDGGNTWEARNALDGLEPQYHPEVTSLAMNPGNTAILLEGVRRAGVFKSENSADSWTYSSQGFSGGVCTALAIDPFAPQKIFTSRELEIVRTTDGGMTWEVAQRAQANSIVIDPNDTNVIFGGAGTSFLTGLVLKSTDAGASWLVSTATKGEVLSIALDPSDSQRVYAGYWRSGQEPGGIVRSLDSGVSWEEISLGNLGVTAVVVDSNSTGLVYACTDNGIYKSNDFGSNWQYVALAGKLVRTVAVHPYNSDILWAGTAHEGIYKSLDRGDTWSVLMGPFRNLTVSTIVFDRLNHNQIFVGTFGSGVYRSEDGGQSWYDFNGGLFNSDIYALIQPPLAPNTIYVATGGLGILKYHMNPSSVNEKDDINSANGPKSFLLANYPNPFNSVTTIKVSILSKVRNKAILRIHNILGQTVRTFQELSQKPGDQHLKWDASDQEGRKVPVGVYFYELRTDEEVLTEKMLFIQ